MPVVAGNEYTTDDDVVLADEDSADDEGDFESSSNVIWYLVGAGALAGGSNLYRSRNQEA